MRIIFSFAIPLFVIALDVITKLLITEFLNPGDVWPSSDWPVQIIYATNTGAAFGLFQWGGIFLIFASIIGIVLVGFFFLRSGLKSSLRIALGLILGGACGNLIDRVIKGEVPDFIKFPESIYIQLLTHNWRNTYRYLVTNFHQLFQIVFGFFAHDRQ